MDVHRRPIRHRRRILCVSPKYAHSFGTFDHAYRIMKSKAFMPPQGLLLIASCLPEDWEVRFIDENIRPAAEDDYRWADAVFISGMHVQRDYIHAINEQAQRCGRITVLGGPSVSACPEWYRDVDILHLGELGDATERVIARLDSHVDRPAAQEVYQTVSRAPLDTFPVPAYHQIDPRDYFLASIQFSSGCPYLCEFCDIPALYGRKPRLKTPAQVTTELDAILACGSPGAVYFVDDNFIAHQTAVIPLLRALVQWQRARGYPVEFACEATLNLAQNREALELMREAAFHTLFCGIETPEEEALVFMHKRQNLRRPILEAIETFNRYGIEVVSGIIIGLDTDTEDTADRILRFIEASGIPLLTINMLHALPKTPLWHRLESEGRLLDGAGRESNVRFLLPYDTVAGMWLRCVTEAYRPEAVYARFERQLAETFPNRIKPDSAGGRLTAANIRRGIGLLLRVIWHAGVVADYRKVFWRTAWPRLKRLQIEEVIHVGMVAYHLISYARECAAGRGERSFYSDAPRQAAAGLPASPPAKRPVMN
jgi:radical SAM superfamily enzyme YgiQ (UPF0313 family)